MSQYTDEFISAFNFGMLYEVGKFWNPADPDVISGAISTPAQRRAVGYVNIRADKGGETKYGVAQRFNPNVRVHDLDLRGAIDIYFNQYWLAGRCDAINGAVAIIHFDACLNHGPKRAAKILQEAVGCPADGIIGAQTLAAVAAQSPREIIKKIFHIRQNFYRAIVANDPSQQVFLAGWMTRIKEVTEICLDRA